MEIKNRRLNGISFLFGGVRYLRLGSMKDGLRNGFGRVYRPNGSLSYEGYFNNSMRQGQGRYALMNGSYYVGEFDRDCMKSVVYTNKKTGQKFRQTYDVERDLENRKDHTTQKPNMEELFI